MNIKSRCKMTESRLASMKNEILAVPLWQHMTGKELADALGYNNQYISGALAELRARGEIEQVSPISLLMMRRYHKLCEILATHHHGLHIDKICAQIYGEANQFRATSRRAQLRELIAYLKSAGFELVREDLIICEHQSPGKRPKLNSPLSFIPISMVDPDHLERFVMACKMNGGRYAA